MQEKSISITINTDTGKSSETGDENSDRNIVEESRHLVKDYIKVNI